MGDALGIALFTPLVLAWLRGSAIEWTKEHVQRAVLVALVLLTASLQICSDLANLLLELGMFFPIQIWVALNFNLRFTSLALTLVFVGSIMGLPSLDNLHGERMDVLIQYVWLYNLLFG